MVEIIKELVALLDGPPLFIYGAKSWLNIQSDDANIDNALIYLDQPLESSDTFHTSGYLEEMYILRMFFLEQSDIAWNPEEHNEVIQRMRTLRSKFINKLEQSDKIHHITNITTTDIINVLDVNLSGAIVEIGVIPFSTYTNC